MDENEQARAAELNNEALLALRMDGWTTKSALRFIYPDPCNERTWLCNRPLDS